MAAGKAPAGAIPPPPPLSILANLGAPAKAPAAPAPPAPPKKPESDLELNIEATSDPEEEAEESGSEEEAPAAPKKVYPQLPAEEVDKLRKKLKKYILEIQFGGKRKDTLDRMTRDGLDPDELDLFFAQDKRND